MTKKLNAGSELYQEFVVEVRFAVFQKHALIVTDLVVSIKQKICIIA